MSVLSKVESFFSKYRIRDCNIAVAFSGGADSSALFFNLLNLRSKFNLQIFAAHVNYNMRGADSQKDEEFVRELCEKHGVKLFVKFADMSSVCSKIEETARNIRYAFFTEIMRENAVKYVATAHNANDQAETLLFNLARKTGISGAAGICPVREDGMIRPFLNVTRSEILAYLAQNGRSFREDKSNADQKFSRNRIRAKVIPELEKINPAAVRNISQFCDFLREAAVKTEKKRSFLIDKKTRIEKIREICYESGLVLNEKHCAEIEKCKDGTGAVLLLPEYTLFVLKETLLFTKGGDKPLEINEIDVNLSEKNLFVGDLWKIEFLDEMPEKGENFAVIQESDYPLKIKNLRSNANLKNDGKTVFERMKKAGVSKFERENSPGIFSANGELLAAANVTWKFGENVQAVKWARIKTMGERT